jgi:uncharacterized protein YggE
MNKPLAGVLLVLALTACGDRPPQVITVQQPHAEVVRPPNVMTVNGAATIEISPDTADLTMTISSEGPRSSDAAGDLAKKQTGALDAMKALGIEAANLKLSQVTLAPVYETIKERERLRGYRAEITITATTKRFDELAAMMEAGAKAGAIRMTSQFRRSDIVELKKKVRLMALRVAREKAETTATTLGITLGGITAVAELPAGSMWSNAYFPSSYSYVPNQIEHAGLPDPAAVAVLGGATQTLTLDVNIGYELGKRA